MDEPHRAIQTVSDLPHDVKLLLTMTSETGDVTALLEAWNDGDAAALPRLMEVVQDELHRIASRLFRRERPGHTLQPTAMVHEVYLKLAGQRRVSWRNRVQFFAVAAQLMRRILVDHARKHNTEKRGGDVIHVGLDEALDLPSGFAPDLLLLDRALNDLEARSPRQSRIVELRVMVGLELEEVATVLSVSRPTVSRDWRAARLFLLSQLRPE